MFTAKTSLSSRGTLLAFPAMLHSDRSVASNTASARSLRNVFCLSIRTYTSIFYALQLWNAVDIICRCMIITNEIRDGGTIRRDTSQLMLPLSASPPTPCSCKPQIYSFYCDFDFFRGKSPECLLGGVWDLGAFHTSLFGNV